MNQVPAFAKEPQLLFINGRWLESSSQQYFEDVNPATEEVITNIAKATKKDVDFAVKSAQEAMRGNSWGGFSSKQRGKVIFKIAALLEKYKEEFATLETLDTGKTITESLYADIATSVDVLEYYAGCATKIEGTTLPTDSKFFTFTLKEPVGVVGCIVPWNFPLLLAVWKIAPALAAGNTVILKPSMMTPLTALRFAKLTEEAGLPPGVLNVLPGAGSEIGSYMVEHPGINKISFTGETQTGKEILAGSVDTLKRVTLELGGKSPNIIFKDADIEMASKGAFNAIFYNKGEVCCAGSRLFVERGVHADVITRLVERAGRTTPGDPLKQTTRLGPLISRSQLEKVQSYTETGKKEGAQLVIGGEKPKELLKGYYFKPTIFDGVRNDMKIAREEIFGPLLSVIEFEDFNDVITKSNDTFYGLAAGIWTRDVSKAIKASRALKAGTVWINCYNFFDASAPFGGYKQSGVGRELGLKGLDPYTELKTVWISTE